MVPGGAEAREDGSGLMFPHATMGPVVERRADDFRFEPWRAGALNLRSRNNETVNLA